MARRRRKFKISGDEYTFGGGASSASEDATVSSNLVRIMKGSPNGNNASFDGQLSPNDEVIFFQDINTTIDNKDAYYYFDSAFEAPIAATVVGTIVSGGPNTPGGVSIQQGTDGADTGTGYFRVYNTPNTLGRTKWEVVHDDTLVETKIYVELSVVPTGYTPTVSGFTSDNIVSGFAERQNLSGPITTSAPNVTYTLKGSTNIPDGYVPQIDATNGQVFFVNTTPNKQDASEISVTVEVDLGDGYGAKEYTMKGIVSFGDAYGARYFGPANLRRELLNTGHDYRENADSSLRDGSYYFNYAYRSGALYKYYDPLGEDYAENTPYYQQNGYGNHWNNTDNAQWYTNVEGNIDVNLGRGYLISEGTNNRRMNSSTSATMIEIVWTAPAGIESFSAVVCGAGGPGTYTWSSGGGGGGGLAWLNAITCEPGEEFDIGIGLGGYSQSGNSAFAGGCSYIRRRSNNELLLVGQAGGYSHPAPFDVYSSTTVAQPNGNLIWTTTSTDTNQRRGGGFAYNDAYGTGGGGEGGRANTYSGGGAGGYRGNGGQDNQNGAGGAAGGGDYYSSTYGASAGGGVGLDGQGWNGTTPGDVPRLNVDAGSGYGGTQDPYYTTNTQGRGAYRYAGGGGSGGARGIYGENAQQSTPEHGSGVREIGGGHHGGGGGGSGSNGSYGGGNSGPGGVRIIWGQGADGSDREFPYTYTTEDPNMKYNGEYE